MKKMLIVMGAFFAVCGFNYANIENAISKELKENLKQQLTQTIQNRSELNSKLFKAAREGDIELVKQLVKDGADVNARDEHKHTPLMYASFFGQAKTCQVLIDLGADVNAKDIQNDTALILAKDSKTAVILIKNKADINTQDVYGRTPLMYALENNNLDTAFALTLYRPNLNLLDDRGSSSVMYLANNPNYSVEEAEHYQSEEFLKTYQVGEIFDRVMRRQDCTLQNKLGQTALDIAKTAKNEYIVKRIENMCK